MEKKPLEGVVAVKKELLEPPCLMDRQGELPRIAFTCGYGDGEGGSGGLHADDGGQELHDDGHGGGGAHDDGHGGLGVAHGGGDGGCDGDGDGEGGGDSPSVVDEATPPYV